MTYTTKRLSLVFLGLLVFQSIFSVANADKDDGDQPQEKPKDKDKGKGKGKGKDNINAIQLISNIPDHLMDFITIVINAFINPNDWHGELCGKTKSRALPAPESKDKKKAGFKLTTEQLEGLVDYLKSASKSMYYVLRLASEILAHPTNWKEEFCRSNPP